MKPQASIAPETRLTDLVTDKLREQGHPEPDAWQKGLHPDAFKIDDQGIQRFLINRRLRNHIGSFEDDTMAVRTCLIDDGTTEDWVSYLDKAVIPCIVKHEVKEPVAQ